MATLAFDYRLPWSIDPEEQSRFRKILSTLLIVCLLLGLVIPFITLTEPEREELEKLPPQLSKVILKKKKAPPPPPKQEKKEEAKPEVKEEKPKEKPKPEKKVEKPKPKPDPKNVEKARKKAQQSGLLKHTDALKDLRQSLNLSTLAKGSNINQGGNKATKVERAVISSNAVSGSGGVSAAGVSRGTAGSGLQGQVADLNDETALADVRSEAEQKARAGKKGKRSDEEIRRVFDANKGPMFTIYNRALRKNPLLEGKVQFEFTIEPDGSVSACRVASSELDDRKLESRLVARIRLFDFGARNVEQGTYRLWYEFTQG